MDFLKRNAWDHGGETWHRALEKYQASYQTSAGQLCESARQFEAFDRKYQLHDEIVRAWFPLGNDRVTLELTSWWLDFFRVESSHFQGFDRTHDFGEWLVYEIHPVSPHVFRLCVLIHSADLEITTGECRVYSKRERRVIDPTEWTPQLPKHLNSARRKRGKN